MMIARRLGRESDLNAAQSFRWPSAYPEANG